MAAYYPYCGVQHKLFFFGGGRAEEREKKALGKTKAKEKALFLALPRT